MSPITLALGVPCATVILRHFQNTLLSNIQNLTLPQILQTRLSSLQIHLSHIQLQPQVLVQQWTVWMVDPGQLVLVWKIQAATSGLKC